MILLPIEKYLKYSETCAIDMANPCVVGGMQMNLDLKLGRQTKNFVYQLNRTGTIKGIQVPLAQVTVFGKVLQPKLVWL